MIRIDRFCVWIFIVGFALIIPSQKLFQYTDELCAMLLGCLAIADSIMNRNWSRYWLLWIFMSIQTFYAIYSVTAVHFNTAPYILYDWVLGLKPYLPLIVLLAVKPQITESDKQILRFLAIFNSIVCIILMLSGFHVTTAVIHHVMYCGTTIFISMLIYILCSVKPDGSIDMKRFIIIVAILTAGLLCKRSKFYGQYIVLLFMLFVFRPEMFRHITFKNIAIVTILASVIILATWKKISFYFLSTSLDTISAEPSMAFARPMLYLTFGLILVDYFPFGSGLASFASYPSAVHYSDLYYEYGLDSIWGLSPSTGDFICDAYYPQLAQYGAIGILLYIWLFYYLIKRTNRLLKSAPTVQRYPYVAAICAIGFILIENIASTVCLQPAGFMAMSIIALVLARSFVGSAECTPEKPTRRVRIHSNANIIYPT